MATQEALTCITREAGADLSAKQYHFVNMSSDGQVDAVASAGAQGIGVLQDKPTAAGQAACIAVYGVSKVVAGADVTAGNRVQADGNGKAIAATTGDFVMGVALTAGNSGDLIEVLLAGNHIIA